MLTACVRPQGGRGGPPHVDACGKRGSKTRLFWDVINGWPPRTRKITVQNVWLHIFQSVKRRLEVLNEPNLQLPFAPKNAYRQCYSVLLLQGQRWKVRRVFIIWAMLLEQLESSHLKLRSLYLNRQGQKPITIAIIYIVPQCGHAAKRAHRYIW